MRPQGDILYIDQAVGHYGIYRPGGSFDLRHRWATNFLFEGKREYQTRLRSTTSAIKFLLKRENSHSIPSHSLTTVDIVIFFIKLVDIVIFLYLGEYTVLPGKRAIFFDFEL